MRLLKCEQYFVYSYLSGLSVFCVGCAKVFPIKEMWFAPDSKPFEDYYCVTCKDEVGQ